MISHDARMTAIAKEQQAFQAIRDDLIREGKRGYAVVQDGRLIAIYASWENAFDASIKNYGTKTPFLIERIESN